MEPQEYFVDRRDCKCLQIIIDILAILFVGVIGLILGVIFAIPLFFVFPVVIAFAIILGIMLLISMIYKRCICKKIC